MARVRRVYPFRGKKRSENAEGVFLFKKKVEMRGKWFGLLGNPEVKGTGLSRKKQEWESDWGLRRKKVGKTLEKTVGGGGKGIGG